MLSDKHKKGTRISSGKVFAHPGVFVVDTTNQLTKICRSQPLTNKSGVVAAAAAVAAASAVALAATTTTGTCREMCHLVYAMVGLHYALHNTAPPSAHSGRGQ